MCVRFPSLGLAKYKMFVPGVLLVWASQLLTCYIMQVGMYLIKTVLYLCMV